MQTITVSHPTGSYPIYLGEGVLHKTGQHLAELGHKGRCAVVTNETVGPHYANPLLESLMATGFNPVRIDIRDGEQFKTLETVARLYDNFIAAKLDRRSPIIALGGGVLGDTVGFAAASFLRGTPFVQIPTSLLSMVDASVGGKTGVDLPRGKNLIGAFKQPEMVVIDPSVLNTLPDTEFKSGMAEVVKAGIIDAPQLFEALQQGNPQGSTVRDTLLPSNYSLAWLLYESINVKVRVVEEDPFEHGRRTVLNLGHTFGHAFERLANFQMRHGEGVAIGMVCAAQLATRLGHCSAQTTDRIIATLQNIGLPVDIPPYPSTEIWAAMFTDKKRQGNTIRFILPRNIGDVDIFSDIEQADVAAILT